MHERLAEARLLMALQLKRSQVEFYFQSRTGKVPGKEFVSSRAIREASTRSFLPLSGESKSCRNN